MRLALGCVGLGGGPKRTVRDDVRLVQGAIDLGVTVFDTADVYGGGASEHVLGRAVRGRRDEVIIATKGGFGVPRSTPIGAMGSSEGQVGPWRRAPAQRIDSDRTGIRCECLRRAGLLAAVSRDAVHASLRRLGTGWIDVYQLHGPSALVPGVVEQLWDLVATGDVVRFGVGADSVEVADLWIEASGVGVVQVPFGVLDTEAASTTLPAARGTGVELWARGVLGGGLLGSAEHDAAVIDAHPKAARVRELQRLAEAAGIDQYQLAFGFVRAHEPDVTTALVGTTSMVHLRRNLELCAAAPLDRGLVDAVIALADAGSEGLVALVAVQGGDEAIGRVRDRGGDERPLAELAEPAGPEPVRDRTRSRRRWSRTGRSTGRRPRRT